MPRVAYNQTNVVLGGKLNAGRNVRRTRHVDWIQVLDGGADTRSTYSLTSILNGRADYTLEVPARERVTASVRKVWCHDRRGRDIAARVRLSPSTWGQQRAYCVWGNSHSPCSVVQVALLKGSKLSL